MGAAAEEEAANEGAAVDEEVAADEDGEAAVEASSKSRKGNAKAELSADIATEAEGRDMVLNVVEKMKVMNSWIENIVQYWEGIIKESGAVSEDDIKAAAEAAGNRAAADLGGEAADEAGEEEDVTAAASEDDTEATSEDDTAAAQETAGSEVDAAAAED